MNFDQQLGVFIQPRLGFTNSCNVILYNYIKCPENIKESSYKGWVSELLLYLFSVWLVSLMDDHSDITLCAVKVNINIF